MSEPAASNTDSRWCRDLAVIWRLGTDRVHVRRIHAVDGLDEAADLLGDAALVWLVLDEPGTTADIAGRLRVDGGHDRTDSEIAAAVAELAAGGWTVPAH